MRKSWGPIMISLIPQPFFPESTWSMNWVESPQRGCGSWIWVTIIWGPRRLPRRREGDGGCEWKWVLRVWPWKFTDSQGPSVHLVPDFGDSLWLIEAIRILWRLRTPSFRKLRSLTKTCMQVLWGGSDHSRLTPQVILRSEFLIYRKQNHWCQRDEKSMLSDVSATWTRQQSLKTLETSLSTGNKSASSKAIFSWIRFRCSATLSGGRGQLRLAKTYCLIPSKPTSSAHQLLQILQAGRDNLHLLDLSLGPWSRVLPRSRSPSFLFLVGGGNRTTKNNNTRASSFFLKFN